MQTKLNKKILSISPSKSITFASEVAKITAKGEKVYRFNVGEPDFFPDQSIIDATKTGLDLGHVRYSLVPGLVKLREKISQTDTNKYQIDIKPEHIFVANGSKNVLYNIFQVICEEGDEVIIPRPFWVSFPEQVKLSGAKPVFVMPNTNLSLNFENIKNAINLKTKALIINFPNNPSGDVPDNNFIEQMIALTKKHNIFLILDLAYEETIFSKTKIDLSHLKNYPEHLFIVKSFSKSYAMTGFRLGYTIASTFILKHLNSLQGHLCGNPCTFAQDGAIAALELSKNYLSTINHQFEDRMKLMFSKIKPLFPELVMPGGGFYLFPNAKSVLEKMKMTDSDFCLKLLHKKNVAILPGSAFGLDQHLRICFATSDHDIEMGMKLLNEFIKEETLETVK